MNAADRDDFIRTLLRASDYQLRLIYEGTKSRDDPEALQIVRKQMEERGLLVSEFGTLA